jgi:hypothetical protein
MKGTCNGNSTDAVRRYRENFLSVVRGLQEAGTFPVTRWDVGRHVLHAKYGQKSRSASMAPARTGTSQASVRTAVVSLLHSVRAGAMPKLCILSVFQQLAEASEFTWFLSRTNRPLIGLEFPIC